MAKKANAKANKAAGEKKTGGELIQGNVDRATIVKFLQASIAMMRSKETEENLKNSTDKAVMTLVNEMQDGGWDDLGVSKLAGRRAVETIDAYFPGDEELIGLRNEFGKCSDTLFIQGIENRRPNKLQTEGKIARAIFLDFFAASSCFIRYPERRESMKKFLEEHKVFPEPIIDEVNSTTFELLGIDRNHAKAYCNEFFQTEEFTKDQELATARVLWCEQVDVACLELMRARQKEGGELIFGETIKSKLMEMRAREELVEMTPEERGKLLEKNMQKIDVVFGLPEQARASYIVKLPDDARLEIVKTEIILQLTMQQPKSLTTVAQVSDAENID